MPLPRRSRVAVPIAVAAAVAACALAGRGAPSADEIPRLRAGLRYLDDLRRPPAERLALLGWRRCEASPPLVPLATLPLLVAAGRGADAALVNVPFLVLLFLATSMIGRRLYSEEAGTAAAVVLAGFPALIRLAGRYLPEIPEAALAALCVAAALRARERRAPWGGAPAGALFGLGMLVRWDFALFCAAPAAHILLSTRGGALRVGPSRERAARLAVAAVVAAVVAGPWYLSNARRLAAAAVLHAPSVPWRPDAAALPMLILAAAGLAVAAARRRAHPALLLWIAVPLAGLPLAGVASADRLVPALPAAAVLAGGGLSLVGGGTARRLRLGAACAVAAAAMAWTALAPRGGEPPAEEAALADALGILLAREVPARGGDGAPVAISLFRVDPGRAGGETFLYRIERGGMRAVFAPPEEARLVFARVSDDADRAALEAWGRPWALLSTAGSGPLPDGSAAVLCRVALTRRRKYDAHLLAFETGTQRPADETGGPARFAGREDDPPGAVAATPPHPLEGGAYAARVRMRYDRAAAGAVAAVEVRAGGAAVVRGEVEAGDPLRAGRYGTVTLPFALHARSAAEVAVLHLGAADLRIESIEIVPAPPETEHQSTTDRHGCSPPQSTQRTRRMVFAADPRGLSRIEQDGLSDSSVVSVISVAARHLPAFHFQPWMHADPRG
ncbi:MAG: glycosyltransferase family 39 protein [bacterium]|nr:glycosyltransferase family 39 protein [bacterium]